MTSFFSDYDNAVRPGFGKIMLSLNQSIFITCEGGGRGGSFEGFLWITWFSGGGRRDQSEYKVDY